MKQYGILGKGSGKLGSAVFAINGGEQIVREYNPKVSNPNTEAQVAQRAKMKLLSQIAADLAQVLFFKKKGLVSARNQFIAANMPLCTYDNEEANVPVYQLMLSPSNTPLPDVEATKGEGVYNCVLNDTPVTPLEGVFYIGVTTETTGEDTSRLRVVGVEYVTEEAASGDYPKNCPWGYIDFVFAVGVKKIDGSKKVFYDDYNMGDATGLAALGVLLNTKANPDNVTQSKGAVANNGE